MELDRQLRKDIEAIVATAVQNAVNQTMAKLEERWLTGKQLCEHFAIAREWMRDYADTLPRRVDVVETLDGKKHISTYKYPMHKINQMIMNGEMKKLKALKM